MARVILQNISKVYPGNIRAVQCANLEVDDKEFAVLVGPSGCGKSTVLRMIAGLETPTTGTIRIGDRMVNDVAPKNRDIAMVFQSYALYPHMTVYKNMAFGLMLRKYPSDEIDRRVREAAEVLDITELLDRRPRALSGGQRQRVALGRAIVRRPKVFLFDEPLSNLDAKLRVQMRLELSKLHARLQATMIYVTHDQVEAMTMGDRIVVMLDGVIQQVSPPLELYYRPVNRFVAEFIGSPPMNMIEGYLESGEHEFFFVALENKLRLRVPKQLSVLMKGYAGKAVVMGIRPEHLSANKEQREKKGEGFTAVIEIVEPLGSELHVHLNLHGKIVIARFSSEQIPQVQQPFVLDVDTGAACFFDPDTQRAIL